MTVCSGPRRSWPMWPGASGAAGSRRRYRGLLGAMARHAERARNLSGALATFGMVTRSYWPGLFHCYEVADLPRTNNDLEQLFGAHRYHERRCSGRKVASPGLVVRGSVRLPAALATRLRGEVRGEDLVPSDVDAWRELRVGLSVGGRCGGSRLAVLAETRPRISKNLKTI